MVAFTKLWDAHPGGRSYPCDWELFGNQCAIRMGVALRACSVDISNYSGLYCNEYKKLKDHQPGHVRSAQELANVFYRNPRLLGNNVTTVIKNGTVNNHMSYFEKRYGMIFIMNGWGTTDHIDVWNGPKKIMKGVGDGDTYYSDAGQKVWFWELS